MNHKKKINVTPSFVRVKKYASIHTQKQDRVEDKIKEIQNKFSELGDMKLQQLQQISQTNCSFVQKVQFP